MKVLVTNKLYADLNVAKNLLAGDGFVYAGDLKRGAYLAWRKGDERAIIESHSNGYVIRRWTSAPIVDENDGLLECDVSSEGNKVLWRGKVVKTFLGPDAGAKASGYAMAMAEGRIRT